MLGAHSRARQDWGTGGAQSASPLWQHQTDLSLQQPELIAESCASWACIFPLHRFEPSLPPKKRGGKGAGKVGDTGEEDVCQSWTKHELCQVSKTNLNLSIAVLIPHPEAGSHPHRELNIVTKGACSTLILFGGPGETNFTIV